MKKIIFIVMCSFMMISCIDAWSEYEVGDKVIYNDIDFYVIENSDKDVGYVTLLKEDALKYDEMVDYLIQTEIASKIKIEDKYIKMAYYSRDNCITSGDRSGCITDYSLSDMKQIVDTWANNYLIISDLVSDFTGYKVRLITYDELTDNLGYAKSAAGGTIPPSSNGNTPNWVYNQGYYYCTMNQYNDSNEYVWIVDNYLYSSIVNSEYSAVRPVITVKKSALGDIDTNDDKKGEENIENGDYNNNTNDNIIKVNVPNTLQKASIFFVMIGIILISIGIIIAVRNSDKIKNKK